VTLSELLALGGLPEGSGDLLEGAELSPEEKARVLEMTLAKAGKYDGYLLEGMACPGGCAGGGG